MPDLIRLPDGTYAANSGLKIRGAVEAAKALAQRVGPVRLEFNQSYFTVEASSDVQTLVDRYFAGTL